MAIHIMRDFSASTSGYDSTVLAAFFTPQMYTMSLFLNKILGYSIVGQTGWDINNTNVQTFTNTATTPIAVASNGQTLPQSTINVNSTTGFPPSGVIFVGTNAGTQIVKYSGTTATTFTNCTGGTGTMTASSNTTIAALSNNTTLPQAIVNVAANTTANTLITISSNNVNLPTGTINVTSTTGFPTSGSINVTTTAGVQVVTYTSVTATTFAGCSGGTGTMNTNNAVNNTGLFIPFPTSGNIFVVSTTGVQTVTYTNPSTTIAIGSNNVNLPTGTINVASTTGFPASGAITVVTTNGSQTVTYTGTSGGNQFIGCTGGTGTMNTGNSVTSATSFGGASGGAGTINTGNAVTTGGGAVACTPLVITSATGTPPTCTTNMPHGLTTGQIVGITNASVNIPTGQWQVTVTGPNTFLLMFQAGGSFSGTAILYPPGMQVASGTALGGTGASINIVGASSVYQVGIPASVRNVVSGAAPSAGDVGRLLVLRSPTYPTKNSGVYKITAVDTVNNRYTIDYRSTDTPPPETGTMDWWLYETEVQVSHYLNWPNQNRINVGIISSTNTAPIQIVANTNVQIPVVTGMRVNISGHTGNTNANGNWQITVPSPLTTAGTFTLNGSVGNATGGATGTITRLGYPGDGYALNSKIIFQSPHAAGWQVRLAAEPWNVTGSPNCTISVGIGGTSTGDWTIGGTHSHIGAFLDTTYTGQYVNAFVGNAQQAVAYRINLVGDDGGQNVFLYARTLGSGSNGIMSFGVPDNEPSPTAPNTNRAYAYGPCSTSDMGGIQLKWQNTGNLGFSFRDTVPEMAGLAAWVNADGVSGTSPTYNGNAGDCPFTGTTEVLPLEVWGGIATDVALNVPFPTAGPTVYSINQRFMGTAPFLRQGRTNFGTFTLSTDSTAAFTVTNATNASPIQITTSAVNALATGQTVVISGVGGNTAANGTFTITVIDNQHFNLNNTIGNNNYTSGGTGNGTAHWLHLQNGIYLQWNGAGGLTP